MASKTPRWRKPMHALRLRHTTGRQNARPLSEQGTPHAAGQGGGQTGDPARARARPLSEQRIPYAGEQRGGGGRGANMAKWKRPMYALRLGSVLSRKDIPPIPEGPPTSRAFRPDRVDSVRASQSRNSSADSNPSDSVNVQSPSYQHMNDELNPPSFTTSEGLATLENQSFNSASSLEISGAPRSSKERALQSNTHPARSDPNKRRVSNFVEPSLLAVRENLDGRRSSKSSSGADAEHQKSSAGLLQERQGQATEQSSLIKFCIPLTRFSQSIHFGNSRKKFCIPLNRFSQSIHFRNLLCQCNKEIKGGN
ncbi:hypothetical protein BaRGS_00012111 [Batillaria attramentaria]|uniref:Uncharacterized protein n=1 Tax=Batillaria attramentaria TaxID=370345 RepID=A0ABD0LCG2_9CAEN